MVSCEGLAWDPHWDLLVWGRKDQSPEAGNGRVEGLLWFSAPIRGKGKEMPKYL